MVLREHKDPLNTSRGIMGPLENSAGVQNNRGRLKQRFDLIRKLGQGTYGKVQLGIDKETGQEVAIKTIKKSKIETEADLIRIRREIQIMSSVRHPNIIHIYEVFENREKMVLVMEYAAGGELYDYLNERKILQEDEARRIFRQIASAVYYCHKNKICHRDLKLENILLDEKSNAKIADFGLSNVFDDINLLKTFCGSPLYASPEIVKGTPYSGPEVDCWSLGVLLYTLVYGAMPFDGSNFKRLVKQISGGDYYEPKKPAEASPLIRRMLTVDPIKRAKVEDICSHAWINHGFDSDCLRCAEELAKQTPVRLDVLLTLAPNHNNVVASVNNSEAMNQMMDDSMSLAEGGGAMGGPGESNTDISEPPKKAKMQNDKAESTKEKGNKAEAPAKPKRKTQVKTKSKTSPLLNVIQDVEEEAEGDLMMDVQPSCDVDGGVVGVTQGQDDDEGDTLSEISEIQTLAEDVLGPKEKVKASNKETDNKSSKVSKKESKTLKTEPSPKEEVSKPKVVSESKKTTPVTVPEVPAAEKVEEPSKTVVKKKVVKPKATAVAVPPEEPKKEEPSPAPEVKPAKGESEKNKTPVESTTTTAPIEDKSKQVAVAPISTEPKSGASAAAVQATPESSDKEGGGDSVGAEKKKKLIRQRSGSVGEVSPTRVERRNSKVISQKTAELIQNLETKTGTSSGGEGSGSGGEGGSVKVASRPPGIKKLVIPSFSKVSDAKSKFEAKPPRPITSSVISQSKAAFEAKAQQSASKPNLAPEKSVSEAAPSKSVPAKPAAPASSKAEPAPAVETPAKPKAKEEEQSNKATVEVKPKEEIKPKESPAVPAGDKKAATTLQAPEPASTTNKSPGTSPKVKPKVVKKDEPASEPIVPNKPKAPVAVPPVVSPVATLDQEVKPVMMDTGKGGPKAVTMVVKGRTTPTPTSSPVPPPSAASPTPPPVESSPPKQNKELAAKKISSVINKIVSSSSNDEKKFVPKGSNKEGTTPSTPGVVKTEVSFPVAAAQSQERVIPIKFVEEPTTDQQHQRPMSPQGMSSSSLPPSATTSRSSVPGSIAGTGNKFSNKRFDSSSSMFSRQNSTSDTESCASIAPPSKPHEAIRKSPREFLIPIKLEGSGQTVTPKEEVVANSDGGGGTGSEDDFRMDSRLRSGRFGRHKRYSSLLSDSSLDEEPSISVTSHSRRPSTTVTSSTVGGGSNVVGSSHARSRSQGDEPETPTSTFKRYRIKRPDLDRSDSFSSAEEDDEDFFEVFTADSLFSNLLDRVRNLTKRINRDGGSNLGPNWPGNTNDPMNLGLWNPSSSLRDLMNRAPSESRTSFGSSGPGSVSLSTHRSFSREPSVSVTINSTGGGPGGSSSWRRSLSRDVSGDSDRSESCSKVKNLEKNESGDSCNSSPSSANPHSSSSSNNQSKDDVSSNDENEHEHVSKTNPPTTSKSKEFRIPIQLVQEDDDED